MSTASDFSNIAPAFAEPVLDSQSTFRELLDALSRPGTIRQATVDQPPAGLNGATSATGLTLFDYDTSVWLSDSLRTGPASSWFQFHCGCPFTNDQNSAHFAIVPLGAPRPRLSEFNQGDPKYPDQSTTIIIEVPSLTGGEAIVLVGPGIETQITVSPQGLDDSFWSEWDENSRDFQLGVDVFLTSGDSVLGLPRTTRRASNS